MTIRGLIEGQRCVAVVELEWVKFSPDPSDPSRDEWMWARPRDHQACMIAKGSPGVHAIADMEALPAILRALEGGGDD